MKFITSLPLTDPLFSEKNPGWTKLEPKKTTMILGLILGVVIVQIVEKIIDIALFDSQLDFRFYEKIYLFIPIIIIHELFHLIAFPKPKNAIMGLSVKRVVFFVATNEIISKSRFMLISLMPAIFLTILPFLLLFMLKSELLIYLCLYNLIGSGIDFLNFYYLLKMPKNSQFKSNGTETYIKLK